MKRLIGWLLLGAVGWAQPPLALVDARVRGANATLLIRDGKIESLSASVPAGVEKVDLHGLHLYPGLVESDSALGLIEIESVRGSVDWREVGDNNADLMPELAVNPDSELLPVARSGGVLSAALLPSGSARINGQVGLISLWGWTNRDMRLAPSPGVVVNWPAFSDDEDLAKARQQWRDDLQRLDDWVEEAQAWTALPAGQRPVRPELAALSRVTQGQAKLFIRAQQQFQIVSALEFCRSRQLRWVLVGGADAAHCAAQLAQERVDVIYTEALRLPGRDYEDYDTYYRAPALLHKAGVRVALAGPHSHDNARWLPQMAALCWAHGWTEEAATESITSVPCEILGLEHQGKLAPGQIATLIACDGPLLDPRTRVVRAWIGGREIDLSDRQKRLYEKYRNKPGLTVPPAGGKDQSMIPDRLPPARRPVGPAPRPAASPSEGARETYEPGVPAWGQSLTGDIRYHEVKSEILGNSRQVWVYLPPSYGQEPDRRYPVVYAMDGQNLFERGTAFGGNEWHLDEAAQQAMTAGTMQEAIIVAVSNAGSDRLKEYSPVPDPDHGGGGAEPFAQFLTGELKPLIDGAYRTETVAEKTAVLGSSMGGLVSLYLGLAHSNTFGLIGALSPSLWWAEQDMLKQWAEHPPQQRPAKIWLDMGDQESSSDRDGNGIPDTLDHTRALGNLLERQGQTGLLYHEIPGGTHTEGAWAARIQDVLEGLLPPS